MVFRPHQRSQTVDLSIQIDNNKIDFVKETIFLGVILDEHLSWKPQILSVSRKCWTACSMQDFPECNMAHLTTPSTPTMRFSTMPSSRLPLFLSSTCTITMSPMAGVFPGMVGWARFFLLKLCKYSFDQSHHTASLHLSKCLAHLQSSAVSIW